MSTVKATNFSHPSAASPAIVLDAAGGATVAGMGLVLVSPTSIANSGGSASASGGQVTFTGVSSVSLNGVFTSTYDNYLITLDGTSSSATVAIRFRLRVGGSDATGTNYDFVGYFTNGTTISAALSTEARFLFGSFTTTRSSIIANVRNPALAQPTILQSVNTVGTPITEHSSWGETHSLSTAYDGFTIFPDSGTITGNLRVYGYKNS